MALELSLFGGFLVSVLPPLLRLPLQALGFGAGGGNFCLQERYPSPTPPPAPAVSLHCHTAVSTHADRGGVGGGAVSSVSITAEGKRDAPSQARSPCPPPPRPVLIIKRPEHRVTGVCELQISQAGQQGNWQEQALRCYSFRARGHCHPQALPPSPRASLLSIHSKSIFLPFADAQFQQ